jgi:cell division protein FtsI/penicillin-binding protein 2
LNGQDGERRETQTKHKTYVSDSIIRLFGQALLKVVSKTAKRNATKTKRNKTQQNTVMHAGKSTTHAKFVFFIFWFFGALSLSHPHLILILISPDPLSTFTC